MIMLYKSTHKKIEKQNLTTQSASIEGALAPPVRITLSVKFFILKCFLSHQLHGRIGISSSEMKSHFIALIVDNTYCS